MNIFISNDDGVTARGISVLADTLSKKHRILVVAPSSERSASSHAVTLNRPLELTCVSETPNDSRYAFSGTPADCVKFGLKYFASFRPDLVLAGINHGPNVGTDTLYSGTVSCAREAAAFGYRAAAVSMGGRKEFCFETAANFIADNIDWLCRNCGGSLFYNVNVPSVEKSQLRGVRFAHLGNQTYDEEYHLTEDGTFLLRLRGNEIEEAHMAECDVTLLRAGYVTVTPMKIDATDYAALDPLKGVGLNL